ncbi:CpsD/CapB family tyrosine-protein kinase [Peribacillus frigoritolerans]|uniref:non-specific protein-tyrosine kinase n=1 Tax=Peribacillus frigoritolerans TaxID=450367 RepID=A0AAJ1QQ61_9BACI|nr:CpsD/CapB family tyrosine-protein kinase [Peribacillus frigoritolerans]MDM5285521.1 CpsD/CapB family tyrosine-protein kinase [Peribacillus frigoritolerans]
MRSKDEKQVNLIAKTNPKSPITEQYRLIRTNIQFSSVDKEIKTIVVTSSEPNDGKSTTAANLAVVLAQEEKKVLLVDADLRKPSVHYAFNLSNIHGLTSVLTKKMDLRKTILNSNVLNLDILSSGPIPPNPSELLNSKAIETAIDELKGMYDYIIFDTPPVLVVPDSQIVANKCDGVIMVVASGKTNKQSAVKAKELLVKANTPLLGVVLNGVETDNSNYYYYQS